LCHVFQCPGEIEIEQIEENQFEDDETKYPTLKELADLEDDWNLPNEVITQAYMDIFLEISKQRTTIC
jgi:hypothetical protein